MRSVHFRSDPSVLRAIFSHYFQRGAAANGSHLCSHAMFRALDRSGKIPKPSTGEQPPPTTTPPWTLVCGAPPAGAHRTPETASLNEILCVR